MIPILRNVKDIQTGKRTCEKRLLSFTFCCCISVIVNIFVIVFSIMVVISIIAMFFNIITDYLRCNKYSRDGMAVSISHTPILVQSEYISNYSYWHKFAFIDLISWLQKSWHQKKRIVIDVDVYLVGWCRHARMPHHRSWVLINNISQTITKIFGLKFVPYSNIQTKQFQLYSWCNCVQLDTNVLTGYSKMCLM